MSFTCGHAPSRFTRGSESAEPASVAAASTPIRLFGRRGPAAYPRVLTPSVVLKSTSAKRISALVSSPAMFAPTQSATAAFPASRVLASVPHTQRKDLVVSRSDRVRLEAGLLLQDREDPALGTLSEVMRIAGERVRRHACDHRCNSLDTSSNRNEGTRSLTTNAVGICRQAGRGVDGCCAVDRFGRVVGACGAVVAEDAAAFSLSGPEAAARSRGVAGDLVRAAYRDRLAASAAGAGLREWRDLLPALGRVAESKGVGAAARALAC